MSDGLSIGALCVAFASLLLSIFLYYTGHRQNKRDLFLSLHEKLTDADLQKGRTILREKIKSYQDAERMRSKKPEDYRLAVRAIAMFDILGLYVQKRFVSKGLVRDEWGWIYSEVYDGGKHVIEERRRNGSGVSAWPHFQDFGLETSAWWRQQQRRR